MYVFIVLEELALSAFVNVPCKFVNSFSEFLQLGRVDDGVDTEAAHHHDVGELSKVIVHWYPSICQSVVERIPCPAKQERQADSQRCFRYVHLNPRH